MSKYVVFIKSDDSKALPKESVTHSLIKEMRQRGFRKYHIEVEAENERDAIDKLNKNNNDYLVSLREFSGDVFICSACVVIMALIYFFS
ncbi:hypothetical protein AWY96_21265 [Serratia plymuthica]|uniref:hypothetical protein n=1 Tax=Serratia plymuthica TaxID=82996 RepID=UPI0007A04875|nr:hypothetical protein [Serratia plymuthica]KYQ96618.1 hypothetical protein AWY96_21265 [Serratia plymuthica]NIC26896.1 hypothetical protein [Serratia plymuthica]QPS88434.1 hypothetical protein I6G46_05525 [Serratia plymuthica]